MPMFQFTAINSSGQQQRGRIEATTREEAQAMIEQHGLRPLEVFPMVQASGTRPGSTPAAPPPAPMPVPAPANTFGTDFEPSPTTRKYRRGGGGGSTLALILSGLAFVASMVALGIVLFRHPLGRGISKYDFSTPEKALRSRLEIEANKDLLAEIEYHELKNKRGEKLKEKLKTLKVDKQKSFGETELLFLSYKEEGDSKYTVQAFKKDSDTKMWEPTSVPFDLRDKNPSLAQEIDDWQAKSEGSKKGAKDGARIEDFGPR